MGFEAPGLEPGDPLADRGLEEESEDVLSYLDGLGPHPTISHHLDSDEDVETPAATYEKILDGTGIDGDTLIEVLNVLHTVGEVYRPREDEYAITSPSEYLPEPDRDDDIHLVRFSSG